MKGRYRQESRSREKTIPVLKVRLMARMIAPVSICIAFLLLLTYRQVVITQLGRSDIRLNDSLAGLQREVTRLKLDAERLGATERIERIARESLELDYPVSSQIVFLRPDFTEKKGFFDRWAFLAALRRSLTGAKG